MTHDEWLRRWPDAARELQQVLLPDCVPVTVADANESAVQAAVRIEASRAGMRLWRNNVGAGHIQESGTYLRWGLCNDSPAVNKKLKSADLIGLRPVVITQAHVGALIAQFVSREIKKPGWHYTGTEREQAQLRWAELIVSLGGDAAIVTGTGSL